MKRLLLALLLALLLGSVGCKANLPWRDHASFRAAGTDLSLAHVEPGETVTNAISRNLHYVSIALDTVFFRNLPGLFGASVVFGVEIYGARADGRPIKTVLDVQTATSDQGFLSFDNVAVVEPFLYSGRNITITLHFKAVTRKALSHIRGRIAGAGDLVKKLDPHAGGALELAGSLFDSVIGAFYDAPQEFKYSFTLYPADSVYRDKPELLFTAARHILIAVPPPGAPTRFHGLLPGRLMPLLKLRGNRLVYRSSGVEFRKAPYIILNVTRYRRYPKPDTDLRRVAKRVDRAIEQANWRFARENLANLAVAIRSDPVITQQEKDLERSWLEIRRARIRAGEAHSRKAIAVAAPQWLRQIRELVAMKKYFREILEPFEIKKIGYQVRFLTRRVREVAAENKLTSAAPLGGYLEENRRVDALIAKEKRDRLAMLRRTAAKQDKLKYTRIDPSAYFTYSPLYKKWWFWTTVLGVAGVTVGGAYLLRPTETAEPKVVMP